MEPLRASSRPRLRWATAIVMGGFILLLVAATVAGLSLSQRQTGRGNLYRFVSPPLDAEGTRFEFLCPRGWHLQSSPAQTNQAQQANQARSILIIKPVDQYSAVRPWVPPVFHRWVPGPEQGEIFVMAGLVDPRRKPQIDNDRVAVYPDPHSSSALRFVLSEEERYALQIKYTRQTPSVAEQAAFRSTYEQVVRSLKITEKTTPEIP
ncbi:MAG: hypothetical protein H7Z41_02950 [Cytophagales bacterium]|nr:hypothetical protein [Armatimonadota bacterium]